MAERLPVNWHVPDELKKDIRKHVGYLIKLCPGWVLRLTVHYSTSTPYGDTCRASIVSDYKYRQVDLTIYASWIHLNEGEKKATIVHEAVHILVAPLQQIFKDAVDAFYSDEENVEKFIHATWDVAHEAVVEDLAHAFIDSGGWGEVIIDEETSTDEITETKPFTENK